MSQSGGFGQPQEEVKEEDVLRSQMMRVAVAVQLRHEDPLNPDNDPNRH